MRFQVSKPVLVGNEQKYALDAIRSGWISSNGEYISRFERHISETLGVQDSIVVANGTVALHLACLAMGLKPGEEVIIPNLTYVATANCVAYCGGVPVLADCNRDTWNIDAASIKNVITPRTVGVIAVHLYGLPCEMAELVQVCSERNLWLIEDCAESLGASIDGRQTGTFGDAATFSFYGNKTISTGEGGALTFRDNGRIAAARIMRGQGMDPTRRYWHPVLGYNYRMTNVAAAIGCGQIEQFDFHIGERRRIANAYRNELSDLERRGLIAFQLEASGFCSSNWLSSIVVKNVDSARREKLMKRLQVEFGIETRPFFVPIARLPMYESRMALPNSEFLGDHGINLPTYSGLADEEVAEICRAVEACVIELSAS